MLPELSGIEVCRIIRAESGSRSSCSTAKDSELDKVVGLELGADDYVTKPFSLRELTARIRALFRRAEQAVAVDGPPAVVDLGSVQADLGGHRLLRDGVVVPLKPKAFELLAFLIRHPGQVFTRDQLLEHVWGYDYGGETRTVDVHVHWLRSRIEADPAASGVPPHRPRRRLRVPPPDLTVPAASAGLVVHPLHRLGGILGRVDRVLEVVVQVAPLDDLDRGTVLAEQSARRPPATGRRPPSRGRGPRRDGARGP